MKRKPPLLAFAVASSLALAAHCDRYYGVQARLPLITPVDSACLRSAVAGAAPGRRIVRETNKRTEPLAYVAYTARGGEWKNVSQLVQGDSSTYLIAGYTRINQGFVRDEQDSIGSALGAFLLGVRDACAGRSPHRARGVTIEGTDPPFEAWTVPGRNARVSTRWSIDHYVLQVDTLAGRSDARSATWLPVDRVKIPRPPKGHAIATECARGDGPPAGSVVGVARKTNTAFTSNVLHAWDVDVTTLRILPGATAGVKCRTKGWSSRVPTAQPGLEAAALTFTPSPGKARIYVYRSGGSFGWRAVLAVAIDGRRVGQVGASTYLMVEVEPGPHRVSTPGHGRRVVSLDAAADSAYFVKVWPRVGIVRPAAGLRRMDPASGRVAVTTAQMARATWPRAPGQAPPCEPLDTTAAWARVNRLWHREASGGWTNDSLRRVLLRLSDADQAARAEFSGRVGDSAYARHLMAVDSALSAELAGILDRFGLPTKSLVGAAGADAAMLLVQHSATLQERVLDIAKAAPPGEVSPEALAMLDDRVLVHRGRPQRLGTQFVMGADGVFRFAPIENAADLDARRAAAGLPPLRQYVCMLEQNGLRIDHGSLPPRSR